MGDKLTDFDYQGLDHSVTGRKAYRLVDVKDHIEKVAFDVVRFKDDDDLSKLWVVQSADDGEVIVAMYDEESLETKSSWEAVPDKLANVNIFYKGEPIRKLSLKSLGIPEGDKFVLCRSLNKKLASDSDFQRSLLKDLSTDDRRSLLEKYPELRK